MNTIAKDKTLVSGFLIVLLSSLLISFVGRLEIPLPFTPIPVSFRAQVILFLALLLGSRKAVVATALFLIQGAMGMPVFAGGTAALIGPNAGYIIGYLFAAFLAGSIHERTGRAKLALLAGTLSIYACGVSVLSTYLGMTRAFMLGIAPFIVVDLAKSAIALKIWKTASPQ